MRIDLHAHTTHSDGTLTPEELVQLAKRQELAALAVTDHDTTSALPECRITGTGLGIEIIAGCEITARLPSGIVHVLAYGFDEEDTGFLDLLARVQSGREKRNAQILAKLAQNGIPLEYEDVRQHAAGRIVARPHFAQAMVDAGHVDEFREAFDLYLRDGGPAYAAAEVPSAEEAIEAVAAAGGAPVLAHPRSLRLGVARAYRMLLVRLKAAGLLGVEVDHPSHDSTQRGMFAGLAAELDLVATGGSDFHGAIKPHIQLGSGDGTIDVPYAVWERLLARAGGTAG